MFLLAYVAYGQVAVVERTFIPDSQSCPNLPDCYRDTATVSQFATGDTISAVEDITAICVNMEHSFGSDLQISLVCPNGSKAIVKALSIGSGLLGMPYGGNNHHTWDPTDNSCDSLFNIPGIGWNYCWSNDNSLENLRPSIIDGPLVQVTYNFGHLAGFNFPAGADSAGLQTFYTTDSSDYANKFGYYKPTDDFSSLIGCPLNGQWSIEICDLYPSDNGWVFGWTLDLKGLQSVGIAQASPVHVNIYPNPASENIVIEGEKLAKVKLYNTLGQQMAWQEAKSGKAVMPVSEYPDGSYVIVIRTTDGQTATRNVVVKK